MKKIFTLIAAAMLGVCANAQDWKVQDSTYPEGSVLLDNDYVKITTANNDATAFRLFTGSGKTNDKKEGDVNLGDYTFQYGINIRVTASPNATDLTGTAHTGDNEDLTDEQNKNVAIVVEAKQNTDVVFYVRVGANKSFDGYNQTTGEAVSGTVVADSQDDSWISGAITFQLQSGYIYTFSTKGGTTTLYAIDTKESTYVEPTTIIYANATAETVDGVNTISYADGAKLTISDGKSFSGGSSITIDSKNYTSIKGSNGVVNTFYAPEGKKVYSFTIYSYMNADKDESVTGFWENVGDKTYTADDANIMTSWKDGKNPDINTYTFEEGLSEVAFKNKGKQTCFVLEVNYNAPSTDDDDTTGINVVKAQAENGAAYNLAGQKVDDQYKGIVVKDGKKFIQK